MSCSINTMLTPFRSLILAINPILILVMFIAVDTFSVFSFSIVLCIFSISNLYKNPVSKVGFSISSIPVSPSPSSNVILPEGKSNSSSILMFSFLYRIYIFIHVFYYYCRIFYFHIAYFC